ncbi:hypothetical protein A3718_00895 [Erythrobacter sp. HI0019]|uniref:hypothetical protein n=1 Tax=unclassified Erythrobacter TaxID=2633097 RepID=UPI0007B8E8E0|nr:MULTISPECIES: hypothetical protein [unclassified Erythrobacter]KZX94642.1 hypothetical protein A3718_00895 [Erythrobacter sp. HI0019]KZY08824.1 hypothetical protein A3723_11745 [Erythrobacter sp. HI0028]
MSEELTASLIALLGEEGLILLAEKFGGRRLYVPGEIQADHPITEALGEERAGKLAALYSPAQIRVPLARTIRARHYRANGDSNGEIATKLGMTETGVDKMFDRMDSPPEKGSAQLSFQI